MSDLVHLSGGGIDLRDALRLFTRGPGDFRRKFIELPRLAQNTVERGGNCELSHAGELVVSDNGVRIVGYSSVTRIAATASALYARNLFAFVETMVDKDTKSFAPRWDDELARATLITRDGAVVHPSLQPSQA